MKILMINVVCGIRSTGRICTDLATVLEEQGHEVKIAYGRESVPEQYKKYAVRIGTDLDVKIHGMKARLFDQAGFGSKRVTEKFVLWIKEYDPDVIHLHNIHGYYLNIEVLFEYLKTCGKKIIWTLHDCWAFTGHCVYCRMDQCEKWKLGCFDCPAISEYPKSITDNTEKNWKRKKALFANIKDMSIITPSFWLANKVKCSFLEEYTVKVINNGIDTTVFKSTSSDIKERFGIAGKKVVLGVAAIWDHRKGLDDFIKLSDMLSEEYKIVLIGLTEEQIKGLPTNILGIQRTNSTIELAQWYSAAEVFVNPTYEDNYPTTNLEAIACGTPVITYKTGGSWEIIPSQNVAEKSDLNKIYDLIVQESYIYNNVNVDKNKMLTEYISVY